MTDANNDEFWEIRERGGRFFVVSGFFWNGSWVTNYAKRQPKVGFPIKADAMAWGTKKFSRPHGSPFAQ